MALALRGLTIVAGATFVLSGCQIVESDTDVAPVSSSPGETVEVEEFIPELVAGGSALENQPYLDFVVQESLESQGATRSGLVVVEALMQAGFSRDVMELTPDVSLIELPVDSTSVSIRMGEDCFIGQWGEDWYVSQVEPVLATGTCLLGETVSLD